MIAVGLTLLLFAAGSATGAVLWTTAGRSVLGVGAAVALGLVVLCGLAVSRSGTTEKVAA